MSNKYIIPPARVKAIVHADEEIGKISQSSLLRLSSLSEIFLKDLTQRGIKKAQKVGRKQINSEDINEVIRETDVFDFLRDIVDREITPAPSRSKRKGKSKMKNATNVNTAKHSTLSSTSAFSDETMIYQQNITQIAETSGSSSSTSKVTKKRIRSDDDDYDESDDSDG